MTEQLETLKQLQALDGEMFQLRKQQAEKPRQLERVNAEVAAQEVRVKAAEERIRALQLAQKAKEGDLQTREANVRRLQGQLFQLKTNKEYSAMQREIDALKADNSLLEESILGAFDAIDQAGKERQQEQARLAEVRQRAQADRNRIEQALAEVTTRIERLERDRGALVPNVPPEALALYERVLDIREGLALVPLAGNACGGCNRRMPPQVINEVLLKTKLVTCETCNRILYFDDAHSKL